MPTPVWWARVGDVQKDPGLVGVSGRKIVLRIPKQFGRIEGWFAKVLRAPKIRRPLDQITVCSGNFATDPIWRICEVMDEVYENIAPVMQRTAAAIGLFQSNNLALMLEEPLNERWMVGPGITPNHQTLSTLPDDHGYDWGPLDGEAP